MAYNDYERHKEDARDRIVEKSRSGRDITSDYPEAANLERRDACERDLRRFLDTYFQSSFPIPWSPDHLRVIERIQDVILHGGLHALAMPRGQGKTTISERAALWALVYGHRRFVSLIGATEKHAENILKKIKFELSTNDLLAADFRQVCYPIRRLANNGRLAIGQLFDGQQTRIDWGADRLTFPTMPDWACDGANVSGNTVSVSGLTGAIRGQSHTVAGGEVIRPELVILDDPQTRESAMSLTQSDTRAAIIRGDVLGMAGPGKRIAAVMPCTVIRTGDLADTILDRKKSPEWSGIKTKMVCSFPDNMKLWEEYKAILDEDAMADKGGARATEFYRENQATMDAGAKVSWPERFAPDSELSGIQAAMNLLFLVKDRAFHAEYQNEPLPEQESNADDLTPDQIASQVNRIPRGVIPVSCTRLTAFIDVHGSLLYWAVCAWEDDFTGYVVDYGAFPDQKRAYFALSDAKAKLATVTKAVGLEGQIYGGLGLLSDIILAREWDRDDGAAMKVDRCLIDSNWPASTDAVYKFCRQSAYATILTPSRGKYIGAAVNPMAEWPKRPGERPGFNWRLKHMEGQRAVRGVTVDVNFWKSFVHTRLATAMGDRGNLSLFGDKPETHRLFADHMTSESRTRTEGRGRRVDEWRQRPERPDNHWFDCLVGCAVGASMQGVVLAESASGKAAGEKKRVSFRELQEKRRQGK